MQKLILLSATVLLVACSVKPASENEDDGLNLTSKFKSTWNVYESMEENDDGTITYHALPWGGLVGSMKDHNLPVDWSRYESVTFEFTEPTKVPTQIMVSDKLKTWGKVGITSLTCFFDGHDVTSVDEVGLQASDTCVITVKNVYLTPATAIWEPEPIWEGECVFGDWAGGFVIPADQFDDAQAGDKLEFIFTTDTSNPEVSYWLFKTVVNATDNTLEGNSDELNQWGCAMVSKGSTDFRIPLTANDVARMKDKGLFVNGYQNIVTRCNLLRKKPLPNDDEVVR